MKKTRENKLNFAQKVALAGIDEIEYSIGANLGDSGRIWTIKHPFLTSAMMIAEFPVLTVINVVCGLFQGPVCWYEAAREVDELDYIEYFDEISKKKS